MSACINSSEHIESRDYFPSKNTDESKSSSIRDLNVHRGSQESIREHDSEDQDAESNSDACTEAHTCLIGKATKKQQAAVTICAFVAVFQTFGLTQAYGIFQTFHTQHIKSPKAMLTDNDAEKRAPIALVGTLGGAGLGYLLGIFMTPALKSDKFRVKWRLGELSNVTILAAVGAFLLFCGYYSASYCSKLWTLIVTQGIVVGIGSSLLSYPILTISPEYFGKRQALAMGFITTGSGLGGLFYSPIIALLLDYIGIRWTLRILAAFVSITGLAVAIFTPPPRQITHPRQFLPRPLIKDPSLYLMMLAGMTNSMGINLPLAYGPDFGKSLGFGTSTCAILLALVNAAGSPSRLILGFLGDKYGRQNLQILASLLSVFLIFSLWILALESRIKPIWWGFNALYGGLASAFGLFLPSILLEVFGSDVFFGVHALLNVARGIGSLIGPPMGGIILGNPNHGVDDAEQFMGLVLFTGILVVVGILCTGMVKVLQNRKSGIAWCS